MLGSQTTDHGLRVTPLPIGRRLYTKFSTVLAAGAALLLVGCGGPPLDAAEATASFVESLERNRVVAETVEVELDDDGKVETLAVVILSEDDVAYEPAVRLACTEDVEAVAAG